MLCGLTGGERSLSTRKGRGAAGIGAKSLLHKTDTGMNGQLVCNSPGLWVRKLHSHWHAFPTTCKA